MTPTTTVSSRLNDTTSSSDSDKTIYEPGNKRKALGLVKYNGPSDNELSQVVKSIWEEKASTEKPLSLFKSLFERHLDMQQIRRWMYRSTESHPRPFILPSFKPIRTNIKSRKSSCSRSRRSNSVFSNASSNASDGSKKSKLTKTHPKNSRSEPKAPDYDDLRRRLFMQRNPDYRGSIIDPLEVSSECSTLIRINEDATTGESPTLPTHLTRDGPSSPKRRRRNLPRCQTPPSKHGDDAIMTSFDLEFASSCDDVKRKRHLTSSCNSANDATPMESTSSNGDENLSRMTSRSVTSRALRPSRATKSAGGETPKPIASPKTVGSRGSQVRRFVNRHSSMGSFIKRVIESGVYD
uniref:Uncharacterized protein n=1 Tax=Ciona savignyi TaxID=51511 RepID=H2YK61_CIOSA